VATLIGELSKKIGIPAHTIRYYEELGLINPSRSESSYRVYIQEDEGRLLFIRQAKQYGFTLKDIKQILSLKDSGKTPCPQVAKILARNLADIDKRIMEMQCFRQQLQEKYLRIELTKQFPGVVCGLIEED
jgi:DNA-binding transcriptional MerR regulator